MESKDFARYRKQLKKTQREMAQLLGTSLKAVHSYEQGWRTVPAHVERQLFFLLALKADCNRARKSCWTLKKCPPERRKNCPAWEFRAGKLCWCINGTICEGSIQENWKDKMEICKSCDVFYNLFQTAAGS